MDFNVPQAEKFWREKIGREIALYIIQNGDHMSLETIDSMIHLQNVVWKRND